MSGIVRRAWRIDRAGSLDRLRCVEEALPPPARGEVRLRVAAIGLNFADAFACQGLYSATPEGSFIPGLECAGTVDAVGEGVTGWHVGDAALALTRFGGYATALNVDVRYLHAVPRGWTIEQAAAWPVQALTAWYGLVQLGNVQQGSVVLVQSAAGGVGLQALAILARLGAQPVAVIGSDSKRDFLMCHAGLAPTGIVTRDRRSFAARLDAALASLGKPGFDVVFDAVLGPWFEPTFTRLAPEGRYVLYGAADFMTAGAKPSWPRLAWRWVRRPQLDPLAMISTNRGLLAFNLIWLWESVARMPAAFAALEALQLPPPHIGGRYPFDSARDALAVLQGGATTGKLLLRV
ncbi:MAG: zinc-binding dehydrogenase [Steroidobacteraceae bacterium]